MFSGIASCSRISSSSTRAMKRKPSAAAIRIRPTSLWSALVAISIQRGRRCGEAVDDQLGARAAVAHGVSPFSIRPTTRSWAAWMSLFWLLDEGFVLLGRDDFDLGPHRARRPGRRGSPSLPVEGAFLVGAEDDLVGLARDGVALAGQVAARTRCGRRRSRPGRSVDRGVDRDDQLVIGEGAVRVVVAPQPLLAGRLDLQRLGFGDRRGRRRRSRASRAPCR